MSISINRASLFDIPNKLNDRMVVLKPIVLSSGNVVRTWDEAILHLANHFWGKGADCNFALEANLVLDNRVYDGVVEIAPDGHFAVRRA